MGHVSASSHWCFTHAAARARGGVRTAALLGVLFASVFTPGAPATADPRPDVVIDSIEYVAGGGAIVPAVTVVRFGDLLAAPVQAQETLGVSDVLACAEPGVIVGISGIEQTQVRLPSPFRITFSPPDEGGRVLKVDLLAGEAQVQSNRPTAVGVGPVVIGAAGTSYGVRLTRGGSNPTYEVFVFDGSVAVLSGSRVVPLVAGGGSSWLRSEGSGPPTVAPVPPAIVESSARLYAGLDVGTARRLSSGMDEASAMEQLTSNYARVLGNPLDSRARLELAEQKVRFGSPQGVTYQLQRVAAHPARNRDLWLDKAQLQIAIDDTAGLDLVAVRRALEQVPRSGPTRLQLLLPEDKRRRLDDWFRAGGLGVPDHGSGDPRPPDADARVLALLRTDYRAAATLADQLLRGQGRASTYLSLLQAAAINRSDAGVRRYGELAMQRDVERGELDAQQSRGLWSYWDSRKSTPSGWAPSHAWGLRLLNLRLRSEAVSVFDWLVQRGVRPVSLSYYGLGIARISGRDRRDQFLAQQALRTALARDEEDHGLSGDQRQEAQRLLRPDHR